MKIEQKATITAMSVAFLLACIKFFVGMYSGSVAILSSAIDSLLDMSVSLFNTTAVHNAEKNPDKKFNYGRGKIEALAAFLEGLIIFISAIYILSESIKKFSQNEPLADFGLGFGVMIISFIITGLLVFFLLKIAKQTKNLIIESDALHYKTDLLTNGGIIVGMIIMYFTKWNSIDAILGIAIAFYIAYNAVEIIKK